MLSGKMETFCVNCAKSFLGKNVNLHLKDGSVIVNVHLGEIQKDEFKRKKVVTCFSHGNRRAFKVPLKSIAWAEDLRLNLILASA
jgi:hypothetical protein